MVVARSRASLLEVCHFPRSKTPVKDLITGKTKDEKIQYLAMEKFNTGLSDYVQHCGGVLPPYCAYIVAAESVGTVVLISGRLR